MADRFMYQAFEAEGLPSVLWVVELDPRGASSVVHRCKQVGGGGRAGVGWGWARLLRGKGRVAGQCELGIGRAGQLCRVNIYI